MTQNKINEASMTVATPKSPYLSPMVDRILEVVDNLLDAHSGVSAASVQGITNSQVEQRIKSRQARSDAGMARDSIKDKPQFK